MSSSSGSKKVRNLPKTLRFHPYAWMKLKAFCHAKDHEIGGMAISSESDPFYVVDFKLIKQKAGHVHVDFDMDHFLELMEDLAEAGIHPNRCGRIWCHTHPNIGATPSGVDEKTFEESFGNTEWAIMFILDRGGKTSCRLRVAPQGEFSRFAIEEELGVAVHWEAIGGDLLAGRLYDMDAWKKEFDACVTEEVMVTSSSGYGDSDWYHGSGWGEWGEWGNAATQQGSGKSSWKPRNGKTCSYQSFIRDNKAADPLRHDSHVCASAIMRMEDPRKRAAALIRCWAWDKRLFWSTRKLMADPQFKPLEDAAVKFEDFQPATVPEIAESQPLAEQVLFVSTYLRGIKDPENRNSVLAEIGGRLGNQALFLKVLERLEEAPQIDEIEYAKSLFDPGVERVEEEFTWPLPLIEKHQLFPDPEGMTEDQIWLWIADEIEDEEALWRMSPAQAAAYWGPDHNDLYEEVCGRIEDMV